MASPGQTEHQREIHVPSLINAHVISAFFFLYTPIPALTVAGALQRLIICLYLRPVLSLPWLNTTLEHSLSPPPRPLLPVHLGSVNMTSEVTGVR